MKLELDIECQECKRKMKVEDMYPGKVKICQWCKTKINFAGNDCRGIQKAIDDTEKSFRRIFR